MMPRPLIALIGGQVCLHACMAGTRMTAPLLALKQGHSAWSVGVLLALFALAPVALSLPAGRLADRHGYHRPVAVGVALSFTGACIALLFQQYAALCVAALLTGGGTSFALVAIQRTAGRSARDATQLKRIFSWLALGPAFSNFMGPFVSGVLIDLWGYRAAFAFLALLPLATVWWARQVPKESPDPAAHAQGTAYAALHLLGFAPLRRLLVVNWTLSTCWDVHTFLVPVLGHERDLSASAIGSILGAFSIAATAVRLVIPMVAHRVQESQVLLVAMLATAALFGLYPFTEQAWAMGACSVLLGAALGSVQPMVMSALYQVTPAHRHGQALGLRMMAINVSSTAMPLLFGAAGAVVGPAFLFWAAAALVLGGSTLVGRIGRDLVSSTVNASPRDERPG